MRLPRFLLFALPTLFAFLAGAGWAAQRSVGVAPGDGGRTLAFWSLETLGVAGLYCLARGERQRTASLWDGVLVAWGAWIFRSPLLLLALESAGTRPAGAWRSSALLLCGYTAGGVALAALDRRFDRRLDRRRGSPRS